METLARRLGEELLASPVDAIICIDEAQAITVFNAGAENIFGYTAEEVLGKNLGLLLVPSLAELHAAHVHEFAASGDQMRRMNERGAVAGRRKDGSEFPAEVSISKIMGQKSAASIAILRDISERVSTANLLRDRERSLAVAMSAGGMGAFDVNESSATFHVDETAARLLGLEATLSEIPLADFFATVLPEDRDLLAAQVEEVRKNGGELRLEYRVRGDNGDVRWLAARGLCEFDATGKPARTNGVVYDVTNRKRVEEERETLSHILEARVAERTQELHREMQRREEMQIALAEAHRLEAIGKLTGGVAHDANNMLTVVSGNLEMLEDKLGDDHAGLKYLREAQAAVERMTQLNRRLLTAAGRRKLQARIVDLNQQVGAMTEILGRVLGEAITLTTTLHADLWHVRLDPAEFDHALLNLAINARDSMPRGGRLHITTKNVEIDEAASEGQPDLAPGKYVAISVTDNGEGIPAEILPRVFEPFFTTKARGKGSGLGLATVHGFTRQSGGHVTIYSEAGRGTTVNVYFPWSDGAAEHGQAPRAVEPPSGHNETILVVEDDTQVRAVTCARLKRIGYQVLEAPDGPTALAMLESGQHADLVFSDVIMGGGMTGFDLMGALEERWPQQRIILTSGFDIDAMRNGERQWAAMVLQKPYTQRELAQAVRAALSS